MLQIQLVTILQTEFRRFLRILQCVIPAFHGGLHKALHQLRVFFNDRFRRKQRIRVEIDAVVIRIDNIYLFALLLHSQYFIDHVPRPRLHLTCQQRTKIIFNRHFLNLRGFDACAFLHSPECQLFIAAQLNAYLLADKILHRGNSRLFEREHYKGGFAVNR
ncbi:hypothetical protein D3C80_1645540 [compost metagenome]